MESEEWTSLEDEDICRNNNEHNNGGRFNETIDDFSCECSSLRSVSRKIQMCFSQSLFFEKLTACGTKQNQMIFFQRWRYVISSLCRVYSYSSSIFNWLPSNGEWIARIKLYWVRLKQVNSITSSCDPSDFTLNWALFMYVHAQTSVIFHATSIWLTVCFRKIFRIAKLLAINMSKNCRYYWHRFECSLSEKQRNCPQVTFCYIFSLLLVVVMTTDLLSSEALSVRATALISFITLVVVVAVNIPNFMTTEVLFWPVRILYVLFLQLRIIEDVIQSISDRKLHGVRVSLMCSTEWERYWRPTGSRLCDFTTMNQFNAFRSLLFYRFSDFSLIIRRFN